jgi:hypothetical protein
MVNIQGRRGPAAAIIAAAVLTSVTACGGQGRSSALPSNSAGSMAPVAGLGASATALDGTADQAPAVQRALAAYRAAFADWAAISAVPNKSDYQNPQLADHMSGQALEAVTGSIYVNTDVDQAISKGAPVLHPTVAELVPANGPTEVVVNDCVDTSSWLLWTSDGKHLYNDTPGGNRKTQSLVTDVDGVWKVSEMLMQKVGTC